MNEILYRKLAATATAPVVRLDSKWVADGSWPKHLRRRANASVSFLLTKHGSVMFDDLTVGFLAERTDTMTVSGPDGCERWAIVAIRYPNMRHRSAAPGPRPHRPRSRAGIHHVRRAVASQGVCR